jgi:hypothetical protein
MRADGLNRVMGVQQLQNGLLNNGRIAEEKIRRHRESQNKSLMKPNKA